MKMSLGTKRVISLGLSAFLIISSCPVSTSFISNAAESDNTGYEYVLDDDEKVADETSQEENLDISETPDIDASDVSLGISGEISEETSETTEEELEIGTDEETNAVTTEEVDVSVEDIDVEAEEASEEEPIPSEPIPTFDISYDDVNVAGIDFTSCELLIGTNDPSIFTFDTEVVSEYKGVYLTRYQNYEMTKNAYTYYYNRADFVEVNATIKASDENIDGNDISSDESGDDISDDVSEDDQQITEDLSEPESLEFEDIPNEGHGEADLTELNNGDDALSNINGVSIGNYYGYVALIDTGASVGGNVKNAVSVLGGASGDDNGHGSKMVNAMIEANPDVNILSIKALDNNAVGTVSDVYAAIQYAINANVSVINLSMSSVTTAESEVLEGAIAEARSKGIVVVASAGNNGRNAAYYTPGNLSGVITIGAVDDKGDIISISNRGNAVDYYIIADSTSIAAAKYSAYYLVEGQNTAEKYDDVFTREFAESEKISLDEEIENNKYEQNIDNASENDAEKDTETSTEAENEFIKEIEDSEIDPKKEYGSDVDLDENGNPWNIVDKGEDYVPTQEDIEEAEKKFGKTASPNGDSGMRVPSAHSILLRGAAYNYEYIIADVTLNDNGRPIGAATFDVTNIHITTPNPGSMEANAITYQTGVANCMKQGAYNPFYHGTGWHNNDVTVDGVVMKYQYTDSDGYWVYYNDGTTGYPYVYLPRKDASHTDPTSAAFQYLRVTIKVKYTPSSGNYINFKKTGTTANGLNNIWFGVWGWANGQYNWIGYTKSGHNGSYPAQCYYIFDDLNMNLHNAGTTYEGGLSDAEKAKYGDYVYVQELGYWGADPYYSATDPYYDIFYNTSYTWNQINTETTASHNSGNWDYHHYVYNHDIPNALSSAEMSSVPTGSVKSYCVPCSSGYAYHAVSLINKADFDANRFSEVYEGSTSNSCSNGAFNNISNGTPHYAAFCKKDEKNEVVPYVRLGFYSDPSCSDAYKLGEAITGTDGIAWIQVDSTYTGSYSVKEIEAPGEYGYSWNENTGRIWTNVHAMFNSKSEALNWAKNNAGTQYLYFYYVGIAKAEKGSNPIKFLSGTTFNIYGSNTEMTADSFNASNATLLNKNGPIATNSEGWIAFDITSFISKYKYYYGVEVETDSDHHIDTSSKSNYIKVLGQYTNNTNYSVIKGRATEATKADINKFVRYDNPRKKFVGIYKKDSNGKNVSATFDIYYKDSAGTSGGTKIGTITTDATTGKTSFFEVSKWYQQGHTYYYAVETKVNTAGVSLPDAAHRATQLVVTENDSASVMPNTIIDPHVIYVKLKKDANVTMSNQPSLKGAVYDIYDNANCTGTKLFSLETIDDEGNTSVKAIKEADNIMTYNYSTNKWNSKTLYAKEVKAPTSGAYAINPKILSVTITDANAAVDSSNNPSNVAMFKFGLANPKDNILIPIQIIKTSANTSCTDNNPNYSLLGATFKVFKTEDEARTAQSTKDYSAAILTFETDKNGNTVAQDVPDDAMDKNSDGTYKDTTLWVIETDPGEKGYILNTDVKSVVVKPSVNWPGSPARVRFANEPTMDPIRLILFKTDESGVEVPVGNTNLEGAEFTLSYYDQDIDGSFDNTQTPTKSWRLQTKKFMHNGKEVYGIDFNNILLYAIDTDFYVDNNQRIKFPRGFLKFEETKAPDGFKTTGKFSGTDADGNEIGVLVDDAIVIKSTGNGLVTTGNVLVNEEEGFWKDDQPIRADIELWKVDENENPMSNVVFRVTNKDTGDVVDLYTDENGYVSTSASYVSHLTDTNAGKPKCGTWFGDKTKISDSYGALYWADYEVREIRTEANTGKQLELVRNITKDDIKANDGKVITITDKGASDSKDKNWNYPKPVIHTTAKVVETQSQNLAQQDGDVADYTNQTIEDVVTYLNLRNNNTYTLKAELMVVDREGNVTPYMENGVPYVRTKTFVTERAYVTSIYEITGQETVTLDGINPTGYEGCHFVVYETLYLGDEVTPDGQDDKQYSEYTDEDDMSVFPVIHADPNDDFQTIWPVDIHTTASDKVSEDHISLNTGERTLVDDVYYTGLIIGEEYTVTGNVMVKPGHTWKVTDLTDKDIPEDADDVTYNEDGTVSYIVKDKLPETEFELTDDSGNPITASKTFIAEQSDGYITLEFTYDASLLNGRSVVAFEKLLHNDQTLAVHKEIHDEDETVHYVSLRTVSWNTNHPKDKFDKVAKEVPAISEGASFTDTLSYHNLLANRNYIAKATLMDQATGKPMTDASGSVIYAETKFKTNDVDAVEVITSPDSEDVLTQDGIKLDMSSDIAEYLCDGNIDVVFEGYDLTNISGKSGVIFEELYLIKENGEEVLIGEHKLIDDVTEFLSFIEIHTNAKDLTTGDKIVPLNTDTIVEDTVTFKNCIPGKEYELTATIHVKNDKSGTYKDGDVLLDDEGNPVTASVKFTPDTTDGTATVQIPLNTNALKWMEIVIFEDMRNSYGLLVATHNNLEDSDQTLEVPGGSTKAISNDTNSNVSIPKNEVNITDTISYYNLVPGREYEASGTLMLKSTGKPFKDKNGKEVTNTVKFIPETKDGTVDVPFTIDASLLAGDTIVVFEDVSYNKIDVFMHHDIDDEEQSVHFPKGHTVALGNATKEHLINAAKDITITDTIYYENLSVDKEYEATGTLMLKSTGKPLLDKDGKEIKNTVKFKPEKANGSIEVPFTIDASLLKGETIVVFEEVLVNRIEVFIHHDINDEDQSVHVPGGHTTATDNATKNHVGRISDKTTITDVITFSNLIPGKQYKAVGTLYNKTTGKPIMENDKPVTNTVLFTPEKSDGTVEVPFTVNTLSLAGASIVVFEDVFYNDVEVFIHHNIEDTDQTIYLPDFSTTATDKEDGDKLLTPDKHFELTDKVSFSNLLTGCKYKLVGTIMDKTTEKELLDINGSNITNETVFLPDSKDGYVNVEFAFDADLENKDIVVFETMYIEIEGTWVKIKDHNDINDKDQTIKIGSVGKMGLDSKNPGKDKNGKIPGTGDNVPLSIIVVIMFVALLGGSIVVYKKKKIRSN